MAEWEPYLEWDQPGDHLAEGGVDRCVLFVVDSDTGAYKAGVPWNGIISITKKGTGGEADDFFSDDIKYFSVNRNENVEFTIKAYTYPQEFEPCLGEQDYGNGVYLGQQSRRRFGLVYRTKVFNDIVGEDYGYKLHIIYNCQITPFEEEYSTINDAFDLTEFTWDCVTEPISAAGFRPISTVTIDPTRIGKEMARKERVTVTDFNTGEVSILSGYGPEVLRIDWFEQTLYGSKEVTAADGTVLQAAKEPYLPHLLDILRIFNDSFFIGIDASDDDSDEDEEDPTAFKIDTVDVTQVISKEIVSLKARVTANYSVYGTSISKNYGIPPRISMDYLTGSEYTLEVGENLFTKNGGYNFFGSSKSVTRNGVTVSLLDDMSLKINGTPTAQATFALKGRYNTDPGLSMIPATGPVMFHGFDEGQFEDRNVRILIGHGDPEAEDPSNSKFITDLAYYNGGFVKLDLDWSLTYTFDLYLYSGFTYNNLIIKPYIVSLEDYQENFYVYAIRSSSNSETDMETIEFGKDYTIDNTTT